MVKQLSGATTETCVHILRAVKMRLHTNTHTHTYNCSSQTHLFFSFPGSLQGCSKGPSGNRGRALHRTMKTEDSLNQSLNEVGAPRCTSGSNYGARGKRIKALSRPPLPLLGLMLLVALPFGASIKQSVPRVKLSHGGKNRTVVTFFFLPKTFHVMPADFHYPACRHLTRL